MTSKLYFSLKVKDGFVDYLSMSGSSDEFTDYESNSEEERDLLARNKARGEDAAKARAAADQVARDANRSKRKRKSVSIVSQLTTTPLVAAGAGRRPRDPGKGPLPRWCPRWWPLKWCLRGRQSHWRPSQPRLGQQYP